jgi:colanic acid biosynthesis glycosyl transferase WcaI
LKFLFYGLNFSPEPVGIGKYSSEWVNWLADRGHSVRVITAPPYFPSWKVFSGHRNFYSITNQDGVSVQRCPIWVPHRPNGLTRLLHLSSFAISSYVPLLLQSLWRPHVVIVVAPAIFCAPGALLLSHFCSRKLITWLHIQDFELDAAFELGILKGQWFRFLAEAWERRLLRQFARVSSISPPMVNLLKLKGVQLSRCSFLPNWVDLETIYPQPESSRLSNSYRNELGIGPEKLILIYSGSMNKKQDLDLLASAIHSLIDFPDLVWIFAGDGPSKCDFVNATNHLPHVIHLPLQPALRMNDWLNAADIHLLPQKAGAADLVLPSKLLGILASGRPVVATSTPGSELSILASIAGFCTPPGDTDAFIESLKNLILNSDKRRVFGSAARKLAEDKFGKEAVLSEFENQLMLLLATESSS